VCANKEYHPGPRPGQDMTVVRSRFDDLGHGVEVVEHMEDLTVIIVGGFRAPVVICIILARVVSSSHGTTRPISITNYTQTLKTDAT
jgi:hypothetical protein